jgi:hypothetical protein
MKNLKTLLIPVGLIILILGIFSFTNPQDETGDEKCTIKIVKIENGVETVIDSTFDCDDEMAWVSSFTGGGESLEKMLGSIMVEGKDDESSFSFNMDFDEDDENGVKIMNFKAKDGEEEVEMDFDFKELEGKDGQSGVFKMTVNGEEMEINIGDIKKQFEGLGKALDKNSENVKIFIGTDEDENDSGNNGVSINIDVEDDNGKESKKIVIISKKVSEKKSSKSKKSTLKELAVEDLKFSPNPNDGRFDLSFELNKKKPVLIKIIDMQGKEVYTERVSDFNGKYFKNIDIIENKEGVYILGIKQGNKIKSSKMIIK